jgi:tetratricopeptide (TPR) repeat protein
LILLFAMPDTSSDLTHRRPDGGAASVPVGRDALSGCAQVLSALALGRLLRHAAGNGDGAGTVPPEVALAKVSTHVSRALRQANERAWVAIDVLLVGEPLWERAQLGWQRSLEEDFYRPLRGFFDTICPDSPDNGSPDARRHLAEALEGALRSGVLTAGALDARALLPGGVPEAMAVEQEWTALDRLADALEHAGHGRLRSLLALRHPDGTPLLVALVAALFRHAVEADADLFGDVPALLRTAAPGDAVADLGALAVTLDRHRSRLDVLLGEVRRAAVGAGEGAAAEVALDADAAAARLQRGQTHAQRGEYDRAILEFTAALQFDPTLTTAFTRRGDAYRLTGHYSQALADYDAALRLEPHSTVTLLNRGQVHGLLVQHTAALADFSAALLIDPRNALALYHRGRAHAELGDSDAALADFSAALAIDPTLPWAHHHRGEAYAARGDWERAIADYSQALRLNALSALSYLRRADAYRLSGDPLRAVADYTEALRLDPFNAQAYLNRGAALRVRGRYDEAVGDFSRALQLDPDNAELFHQRGLLLRLQGEHAQALEDFATAIRLDPHNAEYYFQRAQVAEVLGDADAALADLDETLRLNPQHATAHDSRGALHAARGAAAAALADFATAIALAPGLASAYMHRAEVLFKEARFDEALADCEEVLRLTPNSVTARMTRGHVYHRKGDHAAALADFEWVAQREPDNSQAHFYTGLACGKLGELPRAIRSLTEALRLDPENGRAWANRGHVYQMDGRPEEALDDFARAATFSPRFAATYCFYRGQALAARGEYAHAAADFTLAHTLDPSMTDALELREQALQSWKEQAAAAPVRRPADRSLAPPRTEPTPAPAPTPTTPPAPAPAAPPEQALPPPPGLDSWAEIPIATPKPAPEPSQEAPVLLVAEARDEGEVAEPLEIDLGALEAEPLEAEAPQAEAPEANPFDVATLPPLTSAPLSEPAKERTAPSARKEAEPPQEKKPAAGTETRQVALTKPQPSMKTAPTPAAPKPAPRKPERPGPDRAKPAAREARGGASSRPTAPAARPVTGGKKKRVPTPTMEMPTEEFISTSQADEEERRAYAREQKMLREREETQARELRERVDAGNRARDASKREEQKRLAKQLRDQMKKPRFRTDDEIEATKELQKKWVIRGCVAVAVVVAAYYIWPLIKPVHRQPENQIVQAEAILDEYQKDAKAADQKYAHKRRTVAGKISIARAKTGRGIEVAFLPDSEEAPLRIECENFSDPGEIWDLPLGPNKALFLISGEFQPYDGGPVLTLKDCIFMGQTQARAVPAAHQPTYAHAAPRRWTAGQAAGEPLFAPPAILIQRSHRPAKKCPIAITPSPDPCPSSPGVAHCCVSVLFC